MTILIAILIFGFLIFIHEAGHFLAARLFKVTVSEFSIGMGPKLITKTSKKSGTAYSLRLLPIGGFVNMVGEDEDSDDEGALNKKPVWQRMIIVAAGSVMNILFGVIIVAVIIIGSDRLASNTIAQFTEDSTLPSYGLMVGDEVVKVGGHSVHIGRELSEAIMFEGIKPVDVTVLRNGEKIVLKDVEFATASEGKLVFGVTSFYVYAEKDGKSFSNIVKHTLYYSKSTANMIWKSLVYLVTGRVGVDQMSGPVGVTKEIGEAAKLGVDRVLDLCALIALNLGIFNLLPFPALDGGRLFFMLIELVFRKPVKREIEGYIHFAGLALLMLFMLFITFKDIIKLFT